VTTQMQQNVCQSVSLTQAVKGCWAINYSTTCCHTKDAHLPQYFWPDKRKVGGGGSVCCGPHGARIHTHFGDV